MNYINNKHKQGQPITVIDNVNAQIVQKKRKGNKHETRNKKKKTRHYKNRK